MHSVPSLQGRGIEGFEPVDVRPRPDRAARIDERLHIPWNRGVGAEVDLLECGVAFEKRGNDVLIFLRLAGTRCVDKTS